MKYRADIDGLRAVAVIPVVLFHAEVAGFSGGYIGVDVFFVISGYLITGLLIGDIQNDRVSILRFYERRIRRIFPALFATVLFCAVVAYLVLLPHDLESFGRSAIAATFFASNVLFWMESGYFDAPAEQKPLLHTWSLAVEEQFYIFFPIYLLIIWRFMKRGHAAITLVVLALSLVISVWQVRVEPPGAFFLAPARAWELLLGSCLAMGLAPEVRAPAVHKILPAAGLGLIAWSVVAYSPATAFPGLHALPPCLGAALIIYSGAQGDSAVRRLLSTRPLVFIGRISYSLYLWHWPLLVFGSYYTVREMSAAETGLVLLASTVLAIASWRFIEMPFRGRATILDRRGLFATAGATMAATAVLGGAIVLNDGFPGRLQPHVARMAAAAADRHPDRMACNNRSARDVARGRVCRIGVDRGDEPSFVVWGDSHAQALFPAIDRAASEAGRSGLFVTRAGCPPLLGVGQVRPGYNQACIAFSEAVDELISSVPSIDTVILASRWAIYAMAERYGHESGDLVFITDGESDRRSLRTNREVFAAGLTRTVRRLRRLGKDIVIVAQVPEVGWDVPSVLARTELSGRSLDLRPSLRDYLRRQEFVHTMFHKVQTGSGVRIIWPHRILCNDVHCKIAMDGRLLYFDTNHLSFFGARTMTELFRRVFD